MSHVSSNPSDAQPAPDYRFKTAPFAHQLAAFARTRDLEAAAYLMEMGTGKSKVGIDVASYLFQVGRINALLIIAPKSVCGAWVREQLPTHMPNEVARNAVILRWGNRTRAFEAEVKKLFTPNALAMHVLVMNVEALSITKSDAYKLAEKFVLAHRTMIIVDESTTVKNPSSTRTRQVIKLARQAAYRRIMTGSPVTNSPLDVFSQFQVLGPNLLGTDNFFAFRARYAILVDRYIGPRRITTVGGYQRLDELKERVGRHSVRVLKEECLDLPPKVYLRREVDLSPTQLRLYKELERDAVAKLSAAELITAPLVMTQLLRLRQVLCNIASVDGDTRPIEERSSRETRALETLEEAGEGSALVWTNFRLSAARLRDLIAKELGRTCEVFATDGDRDEQVTRFQAGELKTLVISPRAGGQGLTLTRGTTELYYDNDWSLEARLQSESRTHRMGQGSSVTCIDLVAPGTVDEKIVDALSRKVDLAQAVTGDGWRRFFTDTVEDADA